MNNPDTRQNYSELSNKEREPNNHRRFVKGPEHIQTIDPNDNTIIGFLAWLKVEYYGAYVGVLAEKASMHIDSLGPGSNIALSGDATVYVEGTGKLNRIMSHAQNTSLVFGPPGRDKGDVDGLNYYCLNFKRIRGMMVDGKYFVVVPGHDLGKNNEHEANAFAVFEFTPESNGVQDEYFFIHGAKNNQLGTEKLVEIINQKTNLPTEKIEKLLSFLRPNEVKINDNFLNVEIKEPHTKSLKKQLMKEGVYIYDLPVNIKKGDVLTVSVKLGEGMLKEVFSLVDTIDAVLAMGKFIEDISISPTEKDLYPTLLWKEKLKSGYDKLAEEKKLLPIGVINPHGFVTSSPTDNKLNFTPIEGLSIKDVRAINNVTPIVGVVKPKISNWDAASRFPFDSLLTNIIYWQSILELNLYLFDKHNLCFSDQYIKTKNGAYLIVLSDLENKPKIILGDVDFSPAEKLQHNHLEELFYNIRLCLPLGRLATLIRVSVEDFLQQKKPVREVLSKITKLAEFLRIVIQSNESNLSLEIPRTDGSLLPPTYKLNITAEEQERMARVILYKLGIEPTNR